ncbi:MAG: FAD-binding oxidoreductase [Anaerolineales bacterium]|nr:FAD-binding oxidoreductase [Anaerolineales bacterium]
MLTTSIVPASSTSAADLSRLQARLRGALIAPDHARYDEARRAFNLANTQRPALIVEALSAADVAEAVRFAWEANLGVAIQSTGHGAQPADGALLILTHLMKGVQINAQARTAWVEAGVQWGEVLAPAQAAGLAPLLGSSPGVGVVGYTLGGGLGWLARKYGLAADSVRAFEVVTADGRVRRASAVENADLFWALRGGGGSFGVVTGMEIQLYPVTTVFGGNLIYPLELAPEVLARYRRWIAQAPEALTSSVLIMNFPPLPAVPEFLRGKSAVIVRGLYCGPVAEGEALLREWLEWQAPLANLWRAMPFSEVASVSNDPLDPVPAYNTGAWLRGLSDTSIDAIIEYGAARPGRAAPIFVEVRHIGGALGRVAREANAFGNRDAELLLSVAAMAPTPEVRRLVESHAQQLKQALAPDLTGGVYMNFLEREEARARTRDAYRPENYRRLRALKAQFDPDNLFRFGFNIPPTEA